MKTWKVIVLVLAVMLVTNGVGSYLWFSYTQKQKKQLNDEIAVLNTTLAALGDMTEVYTVSSSVKAGDEITESTLETMTMPTTTLTDSYITDSSMLLGKYYKIALNPLTPLTMDFVMDEPLDDTTRDVDICVDRWTVGLTPGDYVDLRITLPRGDDYVVLSHLRIESIGTVTLKVHLTEEQWHTYLGALVDYYLNAQFGATIYVQKYVEPGIQAPAICYYAVPSNVEAAMIVDPNIVDKATATANAQLRKPIEGILEEFVDEDDENRSQTEGGLFAGGRSNFNGNVNTDASISEDMESGGDDEYTELTEDDVLDDVFVEEEEETSEEEVIEE